MIFNPVVMGGAEEQKSTVPDMPLTMNRLK